MPQGYTIQRMLQGTPSSTGPIPTQTFHAENIAGTVTPQVGSAQSAAGKSNPGALAGVTPMQMGVVILVLIGAGYLLHHFTFEESAKVG